MATVGAFLFPPLQNNRCTRGRTHYPKDKVRKKARLKGRRNNYKNMKEKGTAKKKGRKREKLSIFLKASEKKKTNSEHNKTQNISLSRDGLLRISFFQLMIKPDQIIGVI